jgi:hypothetical protein
MGCVDMASDEAFAVLSSIAHEVRDALRHGATEQDARLQIIDRILTSVLNWPHNQIHTEVHNSRGFADYALIDDNKRHVAVLEAKKTGLLRIDTAAKNKTDVKLSGPVLRHASDGVSQAIDYGTDLGTSYGIVTDGSGWIFFRATRTDGLPPKEGKAIIFPCFDAVLEDFPTFYELLAREAVTQKLNFARLNSVEGLISRPREQRYFVREPGEARLSPRSELGRDVAEVFNRFFAGISSEQDEEMRRACFVETRESREADVTLTKIASHLTNTIREIETERSQALQSEIETVISSQIAEVCLIVGNKGAGKSTFISRFFLDVLPAELRRSCVVASIDLADYTRDEKTLQRWLAERLCDSLEDAIFRDEQPNYEDYQGMFFRVYKRWSEGTHRHLYETDKNQFKIQFGNYVESRREDQPDDYVVGLMRHAVAGRKRLPCLVFDNTDQFPLETQEKVFQFAVGLKNASLSFIVIPITDRSIWRLSKCGAFQSYVSRSFYLPTPAAKEVLARRITYIRTKLDQGEGQSGSYFSTKGIRISIKNLNAFVNILEDAFVRNEALSGLIGRLSNFDIRRMLLLAQRTISSPTFHVEDLIKIYLDTRKRPVDFRRALRAMILGDYDRHTNQTNDFIQNIFWTDGDRPTSPLLSGSILETLSVIRMKARNGLEKAYVSLSDLANLFEPCGADEDDVRKAVTQMLSHGLVESFDPNTAAMSDGTKIGITASGAAHLELALNEIVYLEQMALATGYRFARQTDEMGELARDLGRSDNREKIKSLFKSYILTEDGAKFTVPAQDIYGPLRKLRADFAAA